MRAQREGQASEGAAPHLDSQRLTRRSSVVDQRQPYIPLPITELGLCPVQASSLDPAASRGAEDPDSALLDPEARNDTERHHTVERAGDLVGAVWSRGRRLPRGCRPDPWVRFSSHGCGLSFSGLIPHERGPCTVVGGQAPSWMLAVIQGVLPPAMLALGHRGRADPCEPLQWRPLQIPTLSLPSGLPRFLRPYR
jgi:hypothetical protein